MSERVTGVTRAISEEVKLAEEFLRTLTNPRAPWNDWFDIWAIREGLPEEMAKRVKVTVLRLRMFGIARWTSETWGKA